MELAKLTKSGNETRIMSIDDFWENRKKLVGKMWTIVDGKIYKKYSKIKKKELTEPLWVGLALPLVLKK